MALGFSSAAADESAVQQEAAAAQELRRSGSAGGAQRSRQLRRSSASSAASIGVSLHDSEASLPEVPRLIQLPDSPTAAAAADVWLANPA